VAERCFLVYALAPEGTTAREANDLLNEYVEDRRRGIVVFHDHFTGKPHGGVAVFDVRDEEAYELLDELRAALGETPEDARDEGWRSSGPESR
jgi:hypothetical protein